jgi:hypothetical protein
MTCFWRCVSALLLSSAVGLGPAGYVRAQDRGERSAALAQIAEQLHSEFGPVRFHREEQFEDRFIVRASPGSVFAGWPLVYQVQEERFDMSGASVVERVPNDLPTMYVATSGDGSRVYRLAGFPGPSKRSIAWSTKGRVKRYERRAKQSREVYSARKSFTDCPRIGGSVEHRVRSPRPPGISLLRVTKMDFS